MNDNTNTTYELFPVYVKKLGRAVNYVNCHVKEKGFLSAEKEAAMGPLYRNGGTVLFEDLGTEREIGIEELDRRMDRLIIRIMEKCDPSYWTEMMMRWDRIKQIYDGLLDRFKTIDGHTYDRKAEAFRKLLLEYLGRTYSSQTDHLIGIINTTATTLGYSREDMYRLINIVSKTDAKASERRPE